MRRIQWWDDYRAETFDYYADKLGVTRPQVEGIDYEWHDEAKTIKVFPFRGGFTDRWNQDEAYEAQSKKDHPFKYHYFVTFPNIIELLLESAYNKPRDILRWIRYRTTDKYHVLNLGLPKQYAEPETRMEAAIWTIFRDFVEAEAAHHMVEEGTCEYERMKKAGSKYRSGFYGTLYLLFHADYNNYKDSGCTREAHDKYRGDAYMALNAAYQFISIERPALVKTMEAMWDSITDETYKDKILLNKIYKQIDVLESKLFKLDDKHLKNVVKYRNHLWT